MIDQLHFNDVKYQALIYKITKSKKNTIEPRFRRCKPPTQHSWHNEWNRKL